jgi:uncharacterized protein (UPF0335 family)
MSDAMQNDDLTRYAERLSRMLDAADEARADLKELKVEIKSAGYDRAALVRVVQLRRDERKRAREQERLQAVTLYADRLGVQLDLGI